MTETIAIINQKGGVGKSTSAHAIGCGLALRGAKVLFIDLDPQCNLTSTLRVEQNDEGVTAYNVLLEPDLATQSIIHIKNSQKNISYDIIPASPDLAGADGNITSVGKEYRLKEAISLKMNVYDYIIIDTPPALGILTVNALAACTGIIIPAGADVYSLQGVHQLKKTIDTVKKYCNPHLKIIGILLTRYNPRTVLSRDLAEVLEQMAQQLQTKLFKTAIREGIAIKEAQANKQSIFEYAPKSNQAFDYDAVIDELIF